MTDTENRDLAAVQAEGYPDDQYWTGYSDGFLDARLSSLSIIVDTFNPDNGIKQAMEDLFTQIKRRTRGAG